MWGICLAFSQLEKFYRFGGFSPGAFGLIGPIHPSAYFAASPITWGIWTNRYLIL